MTNVLDQLLNLHGVIVYVIVGLVVFAEDALFVGFVLPGETAAILGGVAASRGNASVAVMSAVVVVAAIVGDSVGYEIGSRYGSRLLSLRVLRRRADRIDAAGDILARRGGPAVFLGRFVAFFRAVMPFLAGTTQMRYRRFLAYNAAGGPGMWPTDTRRPPTLPRWRADAAPGRVGDEVRRSLAPHASCWAVSTSSPALWVPTAGAVPCWIFGRERFDTKIARLRAVPAGWGYQFGRDAHTLLPPSTGPMLLTRGPQMEDLHTDLFDCGGQRPLGGSRPNTVHAVQRAVAAPGFCAAPTGRTAAGASGPVHSGAEDGQPLGMQAV